MRVFIAADISPDTRAELARLRALAGPAIANARVPPRVTWVKEEAAHVTLRFVGEVPDHIGAALEAGLGQGLDFPPFEVRWDTIGAFPGERAPRVIWVGATAGSEQLEGLARLVNARVEPIVIRGLGQTSGRDARPFTPHLTLARIKEPGKGVDWAKVLAAARPKPTVSRIDHVTLYRSRVSSTGATYTALIRAALV